jgi:hypothetical protein
MEKKPRADRMRYPLWSTYAVNRALEGHTNIIRFGGYIIHSGIGGIGSEADLLSVAVSEIINTVMGCNQNSIIAYNATPYHAQFRIEASDATVKARIKRSEVPDLMDKIDGLVKKGSPRSRTLSTLTGGCSSTLTTRPTTGK